MHIHVLKILRPINQVLDIHNVEHDHQNAFFLGKRPGPSVVSPYHFVKYSFKDGIDAAFLKELNNAISRKAWEAGMTSVSAPVSPESSKSTISEANLKIRSGIVGIQRSIEEQHKATDESITIAFKDLTKLMEKAKDMVTLSKNISTKIRVSELYLSIFLKISYIDKSLFIFFY